MNREPVTETEEPNRPELRVDREDESWEVDRTERVELSLAAPEVEKLPERKKELTTDKVEPTVADPLELKPCDRTIP